MKKLAIIGANEFQNPLILKAKEMGYETHVFAWEAGDIGERTADVFHPVSIVEKEEIGRICREEGVVACCSIGSDLAIHTVNHVQRLLGMPCNPEITDTIATNKYDMRRAFLSAGVPCPGFRKVSEIPTRDDLAGMTYPMIVKPTDRSGSRGIFKVMDYDQLCKAVPQSIASSFEKSAIIEEFIDGPEYSCESISFEGTHHILALTKKFTTGAPHFIETGHMEPSDIPESLHPAIHQAIRKGLDALHIQYGASHAEFKLTPQGEVRIIEIGSRMGGDCIGSDLVYLSTGMDYMAMVIDTACGKAPDLTPVRKCARAAIRFIFSQQDRRELLRLQTTAPETIWRAEWDDDHLSDGVTDSSNRHGYWITLDNGSHDFFSINGRFETMKKLMVLGAGFPQAQLINAAKKMGYHTVVCSIPGNYPGFDCADEIAYADISDPEAVLNAAREHQVNGIATCCLDTGVRALGYACEKLGFPGLSEEAAIRSADKWQMKNAFMDAGVNTAKCYKVTDRATLDEALDKLTFPVVLKAVDLQGSKGVYICPERKDVHASYDEVLSLTRQDFCIVEEFIEGEELGAQAFVYQGEILFVLPHGDNTYMSHTAVPVGHYVPVDASQAVIDAATEESRKAIRALGLDNCAVNIDLIERNGQVYVIELTGRAGATCLVELVSIYYGLDYFKMIAAMAMGENPLDIFERREGKNVANASRMLLSEKSGKVKSIENTVPMDENIYDLSLIIREGDTINKFTNAKDRIGQVIVSGKTAEECLQRIDTILTQIKIEVE